ncbi:hypothetical protein BDZ85DRAFT_17151 [Elsinoe ampelina]|uniref:DUF3074 domain-containing protein n=1 Tax=Elsinoe ampelina TaxID=302913 RepID=A0A6A6G6P7_9PEZI|nr:hypothetical protein BDZ85DRAFT_17151 [Elsinoe ampelina]
MPFIESKRWSSTNYRTENPQVAHPRLGLRLRLRRLSPYELPQHADLAEHQGKTKPADPRTFAREVLDEAEGFATVYWPKNFKVKSSSKSSPPSKANVELVAYDIDVDDMPPEVRGGAISGVAESWFGRSSVHENKAERGSADWSEFETFLLDDHSEHEKDYTPAVYDAHKVMDWGRTALEGIDGWEKVEMAVFEMCHSLPSPLNNRVFSVLVVKGRSTRSPLSFVTAQIPVDISRVPVALYSTGRNREEGKGEQKKVVTPGIYVSVERAELLDDGSKVKWQMATASDAKGVLPMWAQKLGVPGAVVKDVGLFMDWVSLRRENLTWT